MAQPALPAGIPTALPPVRRRRGPCAPKDLFVAVRLGKAGIVHGAAGPFLTAADAQAHVAAEFDGRGVAVPFELVFRAPPKAPTGGRPPGHPARSGKPPPPAEWSATP